MRCYAGAMPAGRRLRAPVGRDVPPDTWTHLPDIEAAAAPAARPRHGLLPSQQRCPSSDLPNTNYLALVTTLRAAAPPHNEPLTLALGPFDVPRHRLLPRPRDRADHAKNAGGTGQRPSSSPPRTGCATDESSAPQCPTRTRWRSLDDILAWLDHLGRAVAVNSSRRRRVSRCPRSQPCAYRRISGVRFGQRVRLPQLVGWLTYARKRSRSLGPQGSLKSLVQVRLMRREPSAVVERQWQ